MSRTTAEYWRSGAGLANIAPPGKPEGDDFPAFLTGLVGSQTILEFGCGPGRIAKLFDPARYVGVDICAKAIEMARDRLPHHRFMLLEEGDYLPEAGVTLLHTVLLHVPDEALRPLIERLRSPRVIVSEILGRQWRRGGNPGVFNREADDYVTAFAPRRLHARHDRPYPHYRDTNLTALEFGALPT